MDFTLDCDNFVPSGCEGNILGFHTKETAANWGTLCYIMLNNNNPKAKNKL